MGEENWISQSSSSADITTITSPILNETKFIFFLLQNFFPISITITGFIEIQKRES